MTDYTIVIGGEFRTSTVGTVTQTDLSVWVDELYTLAPGAGRQAMKLALRAGFREFCVRSGAWTRDIGTISIEAGTSSYEIPEQPDCEVLYLHSIQYRPRGASDEITGEPGEFREYADLVPPAQAPYASMSKYKTSSRPMWFVGHPETPRTFTIYPAPSYDAPDSMTVHCSLGPKDPYADFLPQVFLNYHFDAILEGAAAKLLAQQNKPYTNMGSAQYYSRRFNAKIAAARDMARRQFTQAEQAWAYPRWA